jgi:hypothetical protein
MLALERLWLKKIRIHGRRFSEFRNCESRIAKIRVACMWLEKMFAGVLRVLTPLGPRYIKLTFAQRIYLFWIFRHFQILPLQVLTPGQRRFMDLLCVEPRFVSLTQANGVEAPILGTLERRPPVAPPDEAQDVPPRRPVSAISDAVARFAPSPYNAPRRS